MEKKKIIIPACLGAFIAIPVLTGCSNSETLNVDEKKDAGDTGASTISQDQEAYLVVDPNKCIGCGRCIKTDPAHFMMDAAARKSVVISQSDLGSVKLADAIEECPVDAITI